MSLSRRSFLNTAPLAFAPFVLPRSQSAGTAGASRERSALFPTQDPAMVKEMVGVSHGNLPRVKELLAMHPTLARASWDWGFGDWEDALGAASHVGNYDIAMHLLDRGARPTIFSAAMLGQLDVVTTFISASPGIEATPGPHGIPLLRHAMAGGAKSAAVVDYLKTLPRSDQRPAATPITPEQIAALTGAYVFGSGADERIDVTVTTNGLTFTRTGGSGRGLTHVGDLAFFPVGAPLVRIRFKDTGRVMTMTVHDPDLVLTATRTTIAL